MFEKLYGRSRKKIFLRHSVVYNSPKGKAIEVIIDDTTSWLSQSQIAELFCMGRSTITKQINKTIDSNRVNDEAVS